MKLVFPNGEHPAVLLSTGVNRVGSDPSGAVVLALEGMAPRHVEIHVTATGANVQLPGGAGAVTVNGRRVTGLLALRPGDELSFAGVVAKVTATEVGKTVVGSSSLPASVVAAAQAMGEGDRGATRVRVAAPKFVLRGVSGAIFGKVYPVSGPTSIGRSVECDIAIAVEEISRRHASVKPTPEGLAVEDLGSSNGTYINNKRVQAGQLLPGDELRLDQVRFMLVAPGMEMQQAQQRRIQSASAVSTSGRAWARPLAVAVILASAALIAWMLLSR